MNNAQPQKPKQAKTIKSNRPGLLFFYLNFRIIFFFTPVFYYDYMIDKRLSFWPESLQGNLRPSDGATPQKDNAMPALI